MAGAIVVTGAARTGTSLAMQTLVHMGFCVVGHKWHPEFPESEFHPRGCYDLPMAETIGGIHGNTYDNQAIKLFGYQLSRSSPESIGRVIVCHRNREDAAASTVRLLQSAENVYGVPPTREVAVAAYHKHYRCIDDYLEQTYLPALWVHFEEFVTDPKAVVVSIAEFLDYPGPIDEAVGNVIVRSTPCQ